MSIENKNQQGENPPNKKRKKANCFKKISHWFEDDYKFWGELVKFLITGVVLGTGLNVYIDWRNQQADQLTYEQGLVNTYMEDVKGLLLKEYRSPSKSLDPEITHAEIANFVASKTSSLLKTITDAEQRQRLINFLKYSSIATIPEYRYSLYFPDNICSRVSKVKSKYYVDFLCTLNLTSDQEQEKKEKKDEISSNIEKLGCLERNEKKTRINLANISMSDMILENVDFKATILEDAIFDGAQLDHAKFTDALLDKSSFNNTDLQYANMNCAQLKGAKFSNSFLKKAILSNADLSEAKLVGSNLRNADLSNANLLSAYLGVNKQLYKNKTPTRNITDLRGAILSGANLAGAQLIKVDLRGATLEGIKYRNFLLLLNPIKCENSIIDIESYLDLLKFKLKDFIQACPLRVITSEKEVKKAKDDKKTDIDLSDLSNLSNLSNSNLSGFDLSGEDLQHANLTGADLRKTDLRGTDLTGIEFDFGTKFKDAIYDETTALPEGIEDLLKELKYLPKDLLEKLEKLKELKYLPKEELKEDLPKEELKNLLEYLKHLPKEKLKEDLSKELKEKLPSLLKLPKMLVFNSLVKITDYDEVSKETPPNKIDLSFINLQYVNLSNSNLTGVTLLISNLSYARLFQATLTKANLEKANLTRANLEKADLTDAILKGANLIEANLRHATLTNADLQEALLIRTDLRGAKLSQAILERLPKLDDAIYNDETELPFSDKKAKDYGMWKIAPGSDLKGAILRGVDLRDANLCNALIDDKTRLDGVLFNENTRLPKKISLNCNLSPKDIKKAQNEYNKDIKKAQDEYNMVFLPKNRKNGADLRDHNLCDTSIKEQALKDKLNNALFNEKTQLPKRIFKVKCRDKNYKMTNDIIKKAEEEFNMVFCPSKDWNANNKDILTFQRANLQRANLLGVEFKDANLTCADLSGANLRGTYWKQGVNLKGAKFKGTDLRDATFEEVDLSGTYWKEDVNLKGAKFRGTDLRNATFEKVDLSRVDFTNADLRGANLRQANNLSSKQLKNICYDKRTQFPREIKPILKPVCKP